MTTVESPLANDKSIVPASVKARRSSAQRKWRAKNRQVKSQLNVMARTITHEGLAEVAHLFGLTGKAEAVAFCTYVVREMKQKGERDAATYLYLDALKAGFKRNRDVFAP